MAIGRWNSRPPSGTAGGRHLGRQALGRRRARSGASGIGSVGDEQDEFDAGLRGTARSAVARSGSEGDAGPVVARRAPTRSADQRRRDRSRGASMAGRNERHNPQRHHEHALHIRRRLDGDVREHKPCRRAVARRQQIRRHGFPHTGSIPTRDRRAGARFGALGARGYPARASRRATCS